MSFVYLTEDMDFFLVFHFIKRIKIILKRQIYEKSLLDKNYN